MRLLPASFALLLAAWLPSQQEAAGRNPDAELQSAFGAWQAKWKTYTDAAMQARKDGRLPKGAALPTDIQAAEQAASAAAAAALQQFGERTDLTAASYLLLARIEETSRNYHGAVRYYELSLQKDDALAPDLQTLGALCIAAMNSKDDALAARWMKQTIAAEDQRQDGRRNLQVRTSYFPRTLIALGDWQGLEQLLATLATDKASECQVAAKKFGLVLALHEGDLAAAEAVVAAIRQDPATHANDQAWAVMAQLALCVHDGRFEAGARAVRDYLEVPAGERSPMDRNYRRYLQAVAPFLGQPVPALKSDHCVGGEFLGDDVLTGLRGKVVVLDFWQPWCEPCRKAMPEMVRAQQDFPDCVQVLGVCKVENFGYDVSEKQAVRPIAAGDYPAHVADFRKDMQLTYPLLICDTDQNSKAFALGGVPTLVIVDRQGIVRYMSCGAGEPGLFRLALQGVLDNR